MHYTLQPHARDHKNLNIYTEDNHQEDIWKWIFFIQQIVTSQLIISINLQLSWSVPDHLDYGKNALGFRSVNIIITIIIIISFHRQIFSLIKDHFSSRNSTCHSVWLWNAFVVSNIRAREQQKCNKLKKPKKASKNGQIWKVWEEKNKFQWSCNSLGIPSLNLELLLPKTMNELPS